MTEINVEYKVTNASEFAAERKLSIVSDLHGSYFLTLSLAGEYRLARVNEEVTLIGHTYKSEAVARRKLIEHGGHTPVARIISLTDQEVVDRAAPKLGIKITGDSHGGMFTGSAPVRDRVRRWQAYKRVGATLRPEDGEYFDRYPVEARVKIEGGDVTERIGGANKFPFGGNFVKPAA